MLLVLFGPCLLALLMDRLSLEVCVPGFCFPSVLWFCSLLVLFLAFPYSGSVSCCPMLCELHVVLLLVPPWLLLLLCLMVPGVLLCPRSLSVLATLVWVLLPSCIAVISRFYGPAGQVFTGILRVVLVYALFLPWWPVAFAAVSLCFSLVSSLRVLSSHTTLLLPLPSL